MEMQFKNEIKKLADIVAWADNWIEELKDGLTEEEFKDDEEVKEFETVKKVVLESIDRHTVYTDALKNDIADKAAKIELLEKEIEGRKEGYWALKEKYDKLEKELADCNAKIRHQKENLDGINKTLEIRTKENERLIAVKNNLNKEIEAHEAENARLSEKIMELKKERDRHMAKVNDLRMELDCLKASKEKHEEAANEKLVEGLRENIGYWRNKYVAAQEEIENLNIELDDYKTWNSHLHSDIEEWKNQERIRTDQLRATESKVDELWKRIKELEEELTRAWKNKYTGLNKEDDYGRAGFEEYIKYIIEEEEGKFKAELNKRFSEEVSKISTKRTEEELAKAKMNGVGRTSSGRYPWGAKVNDIPCGEDAIE